MERFSLAARSKCDSSTLSLTAEAEMSHGEILPLFNDDDCPKKCGAAIVARDDDDASKVDLSCFPAPVDVFYGWNPAKSLPGRKSDPADKLSTLQKI